MSGGDAGSKLALALAMALAAAAAGARDAGTDGRAEARTLETIVVTGTHIRSIDRETQHPILVLDREDLERTGLTDIADIAQALVVNGQTQNRNINNGNDGRQLVNLRSLGFNRTLVLVNGQRWVSGLDGAVDLSAIPLSLVRRVEVLKDGASAIYGSDAIAGVVNIITRNDFQGADAGAYFGETDHGDGIRRDFDFTWGRTGDKWNVAFGVEYAKDDPVMAGARTISSVPIAGLPPDAAGVPYLMFRYRGPYTLIPGRPGKSPDDFRPFDLATDNGFNYAPHNYLQTPLERRAVFAQARYELTPSLALSADVLFNRRQSAQQLAPPRVAFGSFCCGGTPAGFDYAADSIYNPLGVPLAAFQRRLVEAPPRRWRQTVDTPRVHVGLDGLFDVAGRSVAWGVDISRARASQRETVFPFQDNARLALGVGPSFFDDSGAPRCGTPVVPIAGCVPVDLLGSPGTATPAMLDYVDVPATNRIRTDDRDYNLHATTALAELPAGPLNVAVGAEYRRESGTDGPDPLLADGLANGGGINYQSTQGSYSVNEAYVEFEIPLVANRPLARLLDLDVATRWSKYSRFGSTTNSQVSLRWKPIDDLLLRANYTEGFRAPSVVDLFEGAVSAFDGFVDPCVTTAHHHPTTTTLARCTAMGVPADVPDWGGSPVTIGGNPALLPETARTLALGFVYAPASMMGLTIGLDWYRVRIRNAIGERSAQAILNACYVLGDPNACAQVTRKPEDGAVWGINATRQNMPGGLETEGYDLSLAWRRDTRVGTFALRWESAHVNYYGAIGQPAAGTLMPDGAPSHGNVVGHNDQLNDYFGVVWRLRSIASLAWQHGAWGASIAARYFSPVIESCENVAYIADITAEAGLLNLCSDPGHTFDGEPAPRNRVGAVTYVDLQANWTAPWMGRFTLGVRNAFDRSPPVAYSSAANSFFPDYDIPGRYFYASYRQTF